MYLYPKAEVKHTLSCLEIKVISVDSVEGCAIIKRAWASRGDPRLIVGTKCTPDKRSKVLSVLIAGNGVVTSLSIDATDREQNLLAQVLTGLDTGGQVRTLRQKLGLDAVVAVVRSPAVAGEVVSRIAGSITLLGADIDEAQSDVVKRVVILADCAEIIRTGLAPVNIDAAGERGRSVCYRQRHVDGGLLSPELIRLCITKKK